jgi:hypothetical protein
MRPSHMKPHAATSSTPSLVDTLALLWSRDVEVAKEVDRASMQSAPNLHIVPGPRGASVRASNITGQTFLLHSSRDPQREADEWVESLDISPSTQALILLGFGLGYHVRTLLSKLPANARLFVFEPDASLVYHAIAFASAADVIHDKRVIVLLSIDKPRLLDEWIKTAVTLIAAPAPIEHPASVRRSPHVFAQAKDDISQVIAFLKTSINTVLINGKTTATNIIANLYGYARHGGMARLHNAYAGKPAIIVAAGPSLRKNLHHLHRAVGKAVIIAVQTSFQMLLDAGIEPTFVTSLDYHDISARFFERVPKHCSTELIVEPKATPRVPELHTGPVSFVGSDYADDLLRELKLNRPRLRAGATVAHLSFYLAEYLGCSTAIFIGQDLSFSDGVFYAPGTMHEDVWRCELGRFQSMEMKQWEMIARDRPILRKVPAAAGGHVWTEERMFSYLQQFERDFAASSLRVIDATQGGALKQGATAMPLLEAIESFCTQPLDAPPAMPLPMSDIESRVNECLEARVMQARQIESICNQMLPLLATIEAQESTASQINRAMAAIDQLRTQLPPLLRMHEQIMLMSQSTELAKCKADIEGESGKLEGRERQRHQARRDTANMHAVLAACGQFVAVVSTHLPRGIDAIGVAA